MTVYAQNGPPPHDKEAEVGYLGSVLFRPDILEDPACQLKEVDFYIESHALVFRAITRLHDEGKHIDAVTVAGALRGVEDRQDGEWTPPLLEAMSRVPTPVHAPTYAKIIREQAALRRTAEQASVLAGLAQVPGVEHDELQRAADAIQDVLPGVRNRQPVLIARKLSDVAPKPVSWLWPGRIPLGKLTLLAGDPGLGKSFLTIDIAARVSTGGPWPDGAAGFGEPGSVLVFSAEDDPEDTIRPRLDAAGGDPTRVRIVDGVAASAKRRERPREFALETDLPAVEALLDAMPDCKTIIIDPVSAYGNGTTDTHKNADVRAQLRALSDLAARRGVAVVVVTHLNKAGGGKAKYRVMGSLAYVAAVRVAWFLGQDPADPGRRILVMLKSNIRVSSSGLAFRVEDGRVRWDEDPVDIAADDLLGTEGADGGEPSRDEVERWLNDFLAEGPRPSCDIFKAADKDGFNEKQIRRAGRKLCDKPYKEGFGKGARWVWRLKGRPSSVSEGADARPKMPEDAHLTGEETSGIFGESTDAFRSTQDRGSSGGVSDGDLQ